MKTPAMFQSFANPSVLLAVCCLFSSCADVQEKLDSGWRTVDPAGHHRYHRDRYYKHERRSGINLPGH
jgi:hypothetical protein